MCYCSSKYDLETCADPLRSPRDAAHNGLPGAATTTSFATTASTRVHSRPSSTWNSQQLSKGVVIASATISIIVQARPADLAYTFPISIYPVASDNEEEGGGEGQEGDGVREAGVSVDENKVKTVLGSHLRFSVAPALPLGLVLDCDTGTISGTENDHCYTIPLHCIPHFLDHKFRSDACLSYGLKTHLSLRRKASDSVSSHHLMRDGQKSGRRDAHSYCR